MHQEFEAQLQRLEGKIQWTVIYIPYSAKDLYGTNGRVNVRVHIDGHLFRGTLLPSQKGHYLPFNQAMKTATKKSLGDQVLVSVDLDSDPRTVEVPEWIQAVLVEHEQAHAAFLSQPDYLKREAIQRIMSAKTEDTRQKRLQLLLETLHKQTSN